MNPLRMCTSIVLFCVPLAAALAQDNHVALFKSATGNIQVLRDGSTIPATGGTRLAKSDTVTTGPGAAAGIVFEDGTLLTVGASTTIQIRDFVFEPEDSRYAFSVYLSKGRAIYSSGKIGKLSPESVRVETPRAVVGVRGTRFLVTAEPDE